MVATPYTVSADEAATYMLNGVAVQLATLRRLGVPETQCRDAFRRTVVEMINAAGVPMMGETITSPTAAAPEAVEVIAAATGTKATPERNKWYIAPYERISAGSSVLATYTDAQSGSQQILLIRHQPDNAHGQQWMLPAGYMDPMPSSTVTVPDRANGAAGELPQTSVPAFEQARPIMQAHYRELLKEQGWQQAWRAMNDADYVRALLAQHHISMPEQPGKGGGYDLSPADNARRELREESGLDLANFPQAKVTQVNMGLSYGTSSGGGQAYTLNPHFLVDLGTLDAPPKLQPQDKGEIAEAVWVPVKNIARRPDGMQLVTVPGREKQEKQTLHEYALPLVEKSLQQLLASRITEASGGKFDSPRNVVEAARSWTGRAVLEKDKAAQELLDYTSAPRAGAKPDESLDTLLGQEGQNQLHAWPALAAAVSRNVAVMAERPRASLLDTIIQKLVNPALTQRF